MTVCIRSLTVLSVFSVLGSFTPRASAADSIWSGAVGKILPNDETVWCFTQTSTQQGLSTVTARLQKRSTDGSITADNVVDASTTLRLGLQCKDNTTGTVGAPVISAGFANDASLSCPANSVATYVRCLVRSTDSSPFVYGGENLGDPCANGVSGITLPAGTNGYKGQVTGSTSELNFRGKVANKVFSGSAMSTARVHGTDLGFTFYTDGSLWSGYGDTWENTWMTPVSPTNKRGSVLFRTQDLDASDANGLTLSSWVGAGVGAGFASRVVPSCQDNLFCNEVTSIATAGFGLREGNNKYRVLWFDSITSWTPFTSKVGTLAWSVNGGAFARADLTAPPTGTVAPQWPDKSHFGAGAILQDRLNGYLYFYGQQPYRANVPIRLARVRAKFASVMDQTQYEYWNGSAWIKNAADPLAPSRIGGLPAAADIIGPKVNAGPEFSVGFDAYANRYLLMFETNRGSNSNAVELWQARQITGPFTKVTNGASKLPNANTPGGTWSPYNFFYGPYMSEQLMRNGGQSVYFQLSEWNGIPAFRPYNVGLWTYDITRDTVAGCTP